MPRRAVPLVAGEYYHVYTRGNNRQRIFFERENYLFFLRRIRECLLGELESTGSPNPEAPTVGRACAIVAYCLMPSHYHLLVRPEDGDFPRRMQRLSLSYTKAMNKRHDRVGALFQGHYKALHVDRAEYLLHLSRYIHLNPVGAGLVKQPEDWEFSSYREYVGLRRGTLPMPDVVLSQFPNPDAYRRFVDGYQPGDESIVSQLLLDDD
jgi:REP element-mobilizing transposase RayT